jgi:hypothetical protein
VKLIKEMSMQYCGYRLLTLLCVTPLLQAVDKPSTFLHQDVRPGLYQKDPHGTIIKLPHGTWFKEKDDGHVIHPIPEKSVIPALNSLAMMISGFTTGILAMGIAGWPALCVSGTVFISSMIIQHQHSPWLSPEDKNDYDKTRNMAGALFVMGVLSNCCKTDQKK